MKFTLKTTVLGLLELLALSRGAYAQTVDMTKYWFVDHVVNRTMTDDATGKAVWSEYWQPSDGETIISEYIAPFNSSSLFANWYVKNSDGNVVEYMDQFGPASQSSGLIVHFNPGQIAWGSTLTVNGTAISQSITEYDANNKILNNGSQYVQLIGLLPSYKVPAGTYYNVAKVHFSQSWCQNPASCSAYNVIDGNIYLAPNFGVIRWEWGNGNLVPLHAQNHNWSMNWHN